MAELWVKLDLNWLPDAKDHSVEKANYSTTVSGYTVPVYIPWAQPWTQPDTPEEFIRANAVDLGGITGQYVPNSTMVMGSYRSGLETLYPVLEATAVDISLGRPDEPVPNIETIERFDTFFQTKVSWAALDYVWRYVGDVPSPGTVDVWIEDASITEGGPGATKYMTFKVHVSEPITTGSLVVNLEEINPQADPLKPGNLKYMSASYETDDLNDLLLSPLLTTVTFDANSGTVQEIKIPIIGDAFVEPNEKFSIKISAPLVTSDGSVVNVTDDIATGTILNDDGINDSPKAEVRWNGSVPDVLKDYIEGDIEAAVARLDAALKGGLPKLEISVQPYDLVREAAGAVPVFTKAISGLKDDMEGAKDHKMVLPLASYEKLTGKDLNQAGPDLKIFVDLDEMAKIYSGGDLSKDGTSLMLHEILHGLGVGVNARAQNTTPWFHYERDVIAADGTIGTYFMGPSTTKVEGKLGVHLTRDGKHFWDDDLMDAAGIEPNETLSRTHIAILEDLGYGSKAPKWWTDKKASIPTGVDEPTSPFGFQAATSSDAPEISDWFFT